MVTILSISDTLKDTPYPSNKKSYTGTDHWSHTSDYIRLLVLEKYGGVYLDIDTITFKCFDELIDLNKTFIIGKHSNVDKYLHNAVMLATQNNIHIQRWIDKFTISNIWNYNSLVLPYKLFGLIKYSDIRILVGDKICSTHWSTWSTINNQLTKERNKDIICMHLWESSSIMELHSWLSPF